jgi:GTP cyclohydrolase I
MAKRPTTEVSADASVSQRVRARLESQGRRFHANDCIADVLEPGDMDALLEEVAQRFESVLDALVIDTKSDHNTQDTARRVAKMYLTEVFAGRYAPAPQVTEFPNAESLNELMIVGPVTIRSACSHHFCPIMGRVWIGLMPNQHSNLIGLSKYARLAHWIMSRPQIQEEAITQLADLLNKKVRPDGLAVFLKDPALRREFLSLINLKD